MLTDNGMLRTVEDIKNKICPNEMEEAIVYLFTEMTRLKHENVSLKDEVKRLRWMNDEHD